MSLKRFLNHFSPPPAVKSCLCLLDLIDREYFDIYKLATDTDTSILTFMNLPYSLPLQVPLFFHLKGQVEIIILCHPEYSSNFCDPLFRPLNDPVQSCFSDAILYFLR